MDSLHHFLRYRNRKHVCRKLVGQGNRCSLRVAYSKAEGLVQRGGKTKSRTAANAIHSMVSRLSKHFQLRVRAIETKV